MNKSKEHSIICEILRKTYADKNADYGDSFTKTFKELGLISAVTRITDKCERLKSLSKSEAKVKDESIIDTLMDMANYCIMTVMELEEKQKIREVI